MAIQLATLPPRVSPGLAYFNALRAKQRRKEEEQQQRNEKGKGRALDQDADREASPVLIKFREIHARKQGKATDRAGISSALYIDNDDLSSGSGGSCSARDACDELAWSGSILVWSKGSAIHRMYSFDELRQTGDYGDELLRRSSEDTIVRQALFAYFDVPCSPALPQNNTDEQTPSAESTSASTPPDLSASPASPSEASSRVFGPFHPPKPPPWSDDNRSSLLSASLSASHTSTTLVRVLCVFFTDNLTLYYPDGSHHLVHLPFRIAKAWAMEKGLLVEKQRSPTLQESLPDWLRPASVVIDHSQRSRHESTPSLYAILDPLSDFAPLCKVPALHSPSLPKKNAPKKVERRVAASGKQTVFSDEGEQVLFVSNRTKGEEPIIVSANIRSRRLSIWAYAEIKEDIQSELDRLRRQQVLIAEEDGFLEAPHNNGGDAGMDTEERTGIPTATAAALSVTGKRRRSNDMALNRLPPPPATSSTQRRASSSVSASNAPRRSAAAALSLSHVTGAGTGVADFLNAMGTTSANDATLPTRDRTSIHTNAARRSSTTSTGAPISAAPLMDRRTSTTRNELSVSLDRMALGSAPLAQLRTNTMHMQDSQAAHVGGVSSLLADAGLQSQHDAIANQFGHGQMERDVSAVLDEAPADRPSEIYIARLNSIQLNALREARSFASVKCEIFDIRGSSSILAICLPDVQTTYLYRLLRTEDDSGETATLLCSPLKQLDSVSIASVLSTRQRILDLISVTSSGELEVVCADGHAMPLALDAVTDQRPLTVSRISSTQVNLRYSTESSNLKEAHRSLDVAICATSSLARQSLQTLAAVLPNKAFLELFQAFLKNRRNMLPAVPNAEAEMHALHSALLAPKRHEVPLASNSPSDWSALIAGVSSSDNPQQTAGAVILAMQPDLLEIALFALFLLKEEWKLLSRRQHDSKHLQPILVSLSAHLGLTDYLDQAIRDGGTYVGQIPAPPIQYRRRLPRPPNLFAALKARLSTSQNASPIAQLHLLCSQMGVDANNVFGSHPQYPIIQQLLRLYDCWHTTVPADVRPIAERVILLATSMGWTAKELDEISLGPALPLREAARQCQLRLPEMWSRSAYALLNRPDQMAINKGSTAGRKREVCYFDRSEMSLLPSTKETARQSLTVRKRINYPIESICEATRNTKPISHPQHQNNKKSKEKATRFSSDLRLEDVHRMLQYTVPLIVRGPGLQVAEADLPAEQQKLLLALAHRTLALPFGNAAFAYRAIQRPRSQVLPIPKVELSAKLLPSPAMVTLTAESLAPEQKTWSYFHSGVAVALHIAWGTNDFDTSEFVFNKPTELNARHAGFLLGLGLTAQIRSLATYQAFKYMDPKHEFTSIGILLGLGAAYVGTADIKVTSALSVHAAALHPPSAAPLNVSMAVQSAALVGIGLLHVASRNHKLSDNILRGMTQLHMLGTEHPDGCREGFALASGFAYGFVMLGRGHEEVGPGSASLLGTFKYLLEGGNTQLIPGAKKPVEGLLDVSVTSPAATVALALAFMRTERSDVANMLEIPQSIDRLDHVRPDLVLLRTVCISLIMWESIQCNREWVEASVPAFIQHSLSRKRKLGIPIPYDQDLIYWNAVAGACLAIGLKYAGTAKSEAHGTVIEFLDRLVRVAGSSPVTGSLRSKLTRHSLQVSISTICLGLSAVMAGTGELNVLRRLRAMHGQVSENTSYGTHLASHLALGILFLGKGRFTFGTSKLATAALLCAFYPIFPSSPCENRYHLQAFRHLWVLAVEPRCLLARDVDTGKSVYLPLRLRLREKDSSGVDTIRSQQLVAPTLIPDIATIESIRTDSPRYWPITLDFAASGSHLSRFLRSQTILVKRRAGHHSYAHDPRGIRSVFTVSKSEIGSTVFDSGWTSQLLRMSPETLAQVVASFVPSSALAKSYHRLYCENSLTDSRGTQLLTSFLASVMLETLIQDKPEAISAYRALYLLAGIQGFPSDNLNWPSQNVDLISHFYQGSGFNDLASASVKRMPLVAEGLIESISSHLIHFSESHIRSLDLHKYIIQSDYSWSASEDASKLRVAINALALPSADILHKLNQEMRNSLRLALGHNVGQAERAVMTALESLGIRSASVQQYLASSLLGNI